MENWNLSDGKSQTSDLDYLLWKISDKIISDGKFHTNHFLFDGKFPKFFGGLGFHISMMDLSSAVKVVWKKYPTHLFQAKLSK